MSELRQYLGLALADELIAEGKTSFTFAEAQQRLARSRSATSNVVTRMLDAGLIDRVRHGHYVLRPLGVLGTPSTAEEVALAVGAAFKNLPHRMGYRTALDEHDLITHPARSIHVAAAKTVRAKSLSRQPLRVIQEPEPSIHIGSIKCGESWVSDLERALLDAARRPKLIGGLEVLAEATSAAAADVDVDKLTRHAMELNWSSALRRLGSLADALGLDGLAGVLEPILPIRADLDLEPGSKLKTVWRDARWHLRWPRSIEELAAITGQ
jgi:predicted transcriptional regulator of viral defense system